MNYIPTTEKEKKEMLKEIGVNDAIDLFQDIDEQLILKEPLKISKKLSEIEVRKKVESLAQKNKTKTSFLGAGCYNHYIPSVVNHIISRSEFYTAYTPYQPEISQGALQSIFEFQTFICKLTGMDVANASMYDGSSALAEAAFMSHNITNKNKILISKTVHPEYKKVVKTYCKMHDLEVVEIDFKNGATDTEKLKNEINDETASVIIQNPNFFGCIENLDEIEKIAHENNSLLITCIVEAISLGLLKAGNADIVVGDGQSFGISPSFGGPAFGFMAAKKEHMRKLPGRIVGQTIDADGNKGFILTLQAREQHIRREKATSNICTNQALMALAGTVYLSMLGKQLKNLAIINNQKTNYAIEKINKLINFEIVFSSPIFNEFVVKCNDSKKIIDELEKNNIIAGLDLEKYYPELKNHLLMCVTETHSKSDIDKLVEVMESIK
ncbi:aminomethyl-transferring glycine dehydrogenase [Candidatus Woesearchaeota archaeon]|nr:aminomethyl-transferring glycine dehydrogenase [Candidatus Woesearchaeota archaeon]|tara:strand:- start:4675 stop:5994 length:1320 start_codon:yes stop_codon:yes gene_type:complete